MKKTRQKHKSVVLEDEGKLFIPNLPCTKAEIATGTFSGHLMMVNLVYPLMSLKHLPDTIDLTLKTQGFRLTTTKYLLLCIPLISSLAMIHYARLALHPELIKYSVEVNARNVRQVYSAGKSWTRAKGLLWQCLLLGINLLLVETTKKNKFTKRTWVSCTLIGLAATVFAVGKTKLHFMLRG